MNSRQKGKAGELEAAQFLREHGFDGAKRGVQYRGGGDSPDLVGLPGCHVEVKRTERLDLYAALDQAQRDSAGTGRIPVVAHRRNRREWVAILPLAEFLGQKRALDALRMLAERAVGRPLADQIYRDAVNTGEGEHAERGKP